jgi:hypothetical protein
MEQLGAARSESDLTFRGRGVNETMKVVSNSKVIISHLLMKNSDNNENQIRTTYPKCVVTNCCKSILL